MVRLLAIVLLAFLLATVTAEIPVKTIGHDVHGYPVELPLLGAGTWQYNETIAEQSLCKAFGAGVSLVDTAFNYRNQKGVGRAIADCWTRPRSDLFVLTKVPGGLSFVETMAAHHQNLFELNLEYVDHVMLHFPSDWEQNHTGKDVRQDQWRALEEMYFSGKVRSIGVSHYCSQHIEDIMEIARVAPSLNQVEYHVGSQDVDHVRQTCVDNKIHFMSFSPLCGPCELKSPSDSLVHGDLVNELGNLYNVTGAQIALRFIVQQALSSEESYMAGVIPKSNNIAHIRANMDLFGFEISEADMKRLHAATEPAAEAGDCEVVAEVQ